MKLSILTDLILKGDSLEDKLIEFKEVQFDSFEAYIPRLPARKSSIKFSQKQLRFPRGHFSEDNKKAIALHSFANHELLAIEMMATALRYFPHNTEDQKKAKYGIIHSLKDEQKHLKLYIERLNELGYEFGDFPLNGFFWQMMEKLTTFEKYFSVMSLTFEAANLDFAHHFEKVFRQVEDFKTADILKEVYNDEISHVALGANFLSRWKEDKTLWQYYVDSLPFPITPARSKGKIFDRPSRIAARLPENFINNVEKYQDDFKVTNRKEWKN
ncbi:MAG: ferritin-like domain-containing protein [Bacteriovoracaceae bacterium]|jgi:uncharacterized ferritin-like protein (DUF455 family)|nr:ferritin-like domain-containing protein [Bacteriovoracaceae bacterium]